jgi:small subunit ribosomal protein S21
MEIKLINKNGKRISLDRALKILKRKLDKEGTIKDMRRRRFFEKESVKKYRKAKKAKYVAKLISKENEIWR